MSCDGNTVIVKTMMSLQQLEDDDSNNIYNTKFGYLIERIGKAYSFTFWRTQIGNEIFWSVQGNETGSGSWITTLFLGPQERAMKYQQEVILVHPSERKIQLSYLSTCEDGKNHIYISRNILQHFINKDNSFEFQFKIIKLRRKPSPKRMISK